LQPKVSTRAIGRALKVDEGTLRKNSAPKGKKTKQSNEGLRKNSAPAITGAAAAKTVERATRLEDEPVSLDQAILEAHGGARPGAGRPKAGEVREPKDENQVGNAHLKGRGSIERTLARLDRDGHAARTAKLAAGR
jgi:hypothetical protein